MLFGIVCSTIVCGSPTRPSAGPNIDGVYALTLRTTCTAVPEALRTRTYTATITGSPNAVVTLSGASFWQHPTSGILNRMTATASGSAIRFTLGAVTGYGIVEHVGNNLFLEPAGSGSGRFETLSRSRLTAQISAAVRYGDDLRSSLRSSLCAAGPGSVTLELVRADGALNTDVTVAPSITRVAIEGPASVAPNATAQLLVRAQMSDGSSRLVTEGLSWRSNNTAVQISNDGSARGVRIGEAGLTVTVSRPNLGTVNTSRELVVVPDGTFRIIGTVTEADAAFPVPDALVEARAAGVAVAKTTTNQQGEYRLYGAPAQAELVVTRDGYTPAVRQQNLTGHTTVDFQLGLAGPRADLSGTYTLTLEVGGGCSGSRPLTGDLRRRTYTATVAQNGARLEVRLSGATFAVDQQGNGNRFTGRVEPNGARFTLFEGYSYYYYYYFWSHPDLSERLPDQNVLTIAGSVTTSVTPTGLAGTLHGSWSLYSSRFPNADFVGGCDARSPHLFTMTRVN